MSSLGRMTVASFTVEPDSDTARTEVSSEARGNWLWWCRSRPKSDWSNGAVTAATFYFREVWSDEG